MRRGSQGNSWEALGICSSGRGRMARAAASHIADGSAGLIVAVPRGTREWPARGRSHRGRPEIAATGCDDGYQLARRAIPSRRRHAADQPLKKPLPGGPGRGRAGVRAIERRFGRGACLRPSARPAASCWPPVRAGLNDAVWIRPSAPTAQSKRVAAVGVDVDRDPGAPRIAGDLADPVRADLAGAELRRAPRRGTGRRRARRASAAAAARARRSGGRRRARERSRSNVKGTFHFNLHLLFMYLTV